MKIRHIATRFAMILAIAAMLPLVAYGVWSLFTLQRGTRDSVVTGNLNVATRAAEEIRRYIVGERRDPQGACRRPAEHRPPAVAAGSHPQELRRCSSANSVS